jgi:hypothetical protein
MSHLRWALVALLVLSTALFAIGVIAERSNADTPTESARAQVSESSEAAGEDAHEAGAAESEEGHTDEGTAGETHSDEDEALFGIELESTPFLVLAVIAGLALAGLTATRLGQLPAFLLAVALIALAWAALDVREFLHQLDESREGIAIVAALVALLHLAAVAVAGRLARQRSSPA